MKTKNFAILFIIIMLLSAVAALSAGTKTPQKTCPVMGGEINKSLFVDQDGKRIYVCCEGCIAEVKKNFATYEKKLEESGQSLEVVTKTDAKKECNDCKTEVKTSEKSCCSGTQAKVEKTNCSSGNCKK